MRNLLQDKLLKAGLAKKSTLNQVVREQRQSGKDHAQDTPDAAVLAAERAERDRALAAAQREERLRHERLAQIRQILATHAVAPGDDAPYRFVDGTAIRSLRVDALQRRKLAAGTLVIARTEVDEHYVLLPREAADKVYARDPAWIVLDHARGSAQAAPATDPAPSIDTDAHAEWYARFQVPDDLVW